MLSSADRGVKGVPWYITGLVIRSVSLRVIGPGAIAVAFRPVSVRQGPRDSQCPRQSNMLVRHRQSVETGRFLQSHPVRQFTFPRPSWVVRYVGPPLPSCMRHSSRRWRLPNVSRSP